MALTFTQLTDEVMFNAFEGTGFTTRAQRFLNEAVNEVGRRVGFLLKTFEVAPFDATGTVTLSQPFFRFDEVWLATGPAATTSVALTTQATRRLPPVMQDSGATNIIRSGSPSEYQAQYAPGDRPSAGLRVFPAGQTGFVGVVGRALPPVMVAPGDFSGLGGEWDDALVCFARSRCFRTEDDFQAAQVWMAEFDQHVRTLAKARTPSTDSPIITPGDDWTGTPTSGGA
jgi:hypothetical protein